MRLSTYWLVLGTALLVAVLVKYEPAANCFVHSPKNELNEYVYDTGTAPGFAELDEALDIIKNHGFEFIRRTNANGTLTYEVIPPYRFCQVEAIELSTSLQIARNSHGNDELVKVLVINANNHEIVDYEAFNKMIYFKR